MSSLWGLAGLIVVLVVVWWNDQRTRAWRLLRRARNLPIAEIKDGEWVKVTGVAGAIDPSMTALITQRECIGFRVEVRDKVGGQRSTELARDTCGAFSITDDTGTVDVDGPVLLGIDWDDGPNDVMDDRLQILKDAGVTTEDFFGPRKFVYREALLRSGDRVTVLGLASLEPDPTKPPPDLRSPALKIHLRGSGKKRVVVAPPTMHPDDAPY